MPTIPRVPGLEHSLALLRDPYRFISTQCDRLGSDAIEIRLLLQRTICLRGAEAARMFYGSDLMRRRGAAPARVEKTLVGRGGVQGLDDEDHRHRKQLFLSLTTPECVAALAALVEAQWERQARAWNGQPRIVLYDALRELLMRAVCAWAGVPLVETEVARRTAEIAAMFDYAGSVGPRHWWARIARRRAERWAQALIAAIRRGEVHPPEDSAALAVANHRDRQGRPLAPPIAAVELLNVIRPTVAVAVYLVQTAHALQRHPQWQRHIAADADGDATTWFVQEVRRWYPFFPAAVARVREPCSWQGYDLPGGRRVLLDLYGTNHDRRAWGDPAEFRPERFRDWSGDSWSFIPQGGGDARTSHRCPGEPVAIALMAASARFLCTRIDYALPPQDLELDLTRMPALPKSRLVIGAVRPRD